MELYQPLHPDSSSTFHFLRQVNAKYHLSLATYADLYAWSTTYIHDFWETVWDETGVIGYKGDHVVDHAPVPGNPPWFSQAKINWAENLLACRSSDKIALVQASTFT